MTDRIKKKLELLKDGEYKRWRRALEHSEIEFPDGTDTMVADTYLLKYMIESEKPVLFVDDIFGFNRTIATPPKASIGNQPHNEGIGNITINYSYALEVGMDTLLERINAKLAACEDPQKRVFYNCMRECISVCLALADRYRDYAKERGAAKLYNALCQVPHRAA